MILSELLRKLATEKRLFVDTNYYSQTSETDWVNKISGTITLNEESLVLLKARLRAGYMGYSCLRIRQNTTPIFTSGVYTTEEITGELFTFWLIRQLIAGTYTFNLDIAAPDIYPDYYPQV